MIIEERSVKLEVDTRGSTPAVGKNSIGEVVLHLTRNAGPIIANPKNPQVNAEPDKDKSSKLSAIRIKGSVDVGMDQPGDDLRWWDFGFIQFAKLMVHQRIWVGRTDTAGGVLQVNFAGPPLVQPQFAYHWIHDSSKPNMPFLNPKPPVIQQLFTPRGVPAVRVSTDMNDHPNFGTPSHLADVDLFLFRAHSTFDMVTAFIARHMSEKKILVLAHVFWSIVWNVRFSWLHGNPVPHFEDKSFSVGKITNGAPKDRDLANLITTAAMITDRNADNSKTMNVLMNRAREQFQLLYKQGTMAGWFVGGKRPSDVPENFFK